MLIIYKYIIIYLSSWDKNKYNKKSHCIQVSVSKLLGNGWDNIKMPRGFFEQNVKVENGKVENTTEFCIFELI